MTEELKNYLRNNITYIDNEDWIKLVYYCPEHLVSELVAILLSTELVDTPELYKGMFFANKVTLPETDLHVVLDKELTLPDNALLDATLRSLSFDAVKEIGVLALSYMSVNRVVIPEGCTTIEDGAFQYSSIGELYLPSTLLLNTLGEDIFHGAWIDKIIYNGTKLMFQTLCESAGKINAKCITRVICKDGVIRLTHGGVSIP